MTPQELSDAVFKARGYERKLHGWVGEGTFLSSYHLWTDDSRWPILFRELPQPCVYRNYANKCWVQIIDTDVYETEQHSSEGEAVCTAWLKWKGII